MKKGILHRLLVGMLMVVLAASCSGDAGDPVQGTDSQKAQVVFTLALDNGRSGSRATTWGDTYDSDIGGDYDNYIDFDRFKVMLGNWEVKNIVHYKETSVKNVYELIGEVEVNATTSFSGKIMVYANMGGTEADATFNQSTTDGIPMWGVQTVNITLTPGERTDVGTIYLLRAMAKVEIDMTGVENYTLESVTLNKYNTTGYCLPNNWDEVDYTTKLCFDDNTPSCFNPKVSLGTNLPFTVTGNNLVFYIPEYTNGTKDTDNELMMTVTLKKGTETVNLSKLYLYFRNYNTSGNADDGTPFNIVRNHWYKYTITAVNDGVDMELSLAVNPWNVDEEELQYTNDVTIKTKMSGWTGTYAVVSSSDQSVYYIDGSVDAETAASCTFQIDTPTGATWYASFEGDKDAFAFLDDEDNQVSFMTGNVDEAATLRVVTTSAKVSETKSVQLKVVVRTIDGRTIDATKMLMPTDIDADCYQLKQNVSI